MSASKSRSTSPGSASYSRCNCSAASCAVGRPSAPARLVSPLHRTKMFGRCRHPAAPPCHRQVGTRRGRHNDTEGSQRRRDTFLFRRGSGVSLTQADALVFEPHRRYDRRTPSARNVTDRVAFASRGGRTGLRPRGWRQLGTVLQRLAPWQALKWNRSLPESDASRFRS